MQNWCDYRVFFYVGVGVQNILYECMHHPEFCCKLKELGCWKIWTYAVFPKKLSFRSQFKNSSSWSLHLQNHLSFLMFCGRLFVFISQNSEILPWFGLLKCSLFFYCS